MMDVTQIASKPEAIPTQMEMAPVLQADTVFKPGTCNGGDASIARRTA
jgi:hypothetical protein